MSIILLAVMLSALIGATPVFRASRPGRARCGYAFGRRMPIKISNAMCTSELSGRDAYPIRGESQNWRRFLPPN